MVKCFLFLVLLSFNCVRISNTTYLPHLRRWEEDFSLCAGLIPSESFKCFVCWSLHKTSRLAARPRRTSVALSARKTLVELLERIAALNWFEAGQLRFGEACPASHLGPPPGLNMDSLQASVLRSFVPHSRAQNSDGKSDRKIWSKTIASDRKKDKHPTGNPIGNKIR